MLRRYAIGVVITNLAVILWGAFVRATGSGAGCGSHWPMCNGEVIPRAPSVETAIELTHRVTSGLALLMVVALLVLALVKRPKGHPLRAAAVLAMVFMLLEAAVGAGLVLLELVATNQSVARAWWMAAHLTNTFLLVASLTLCARYAAPDARAEWRANGVAGMIFAALLGTMVVGVTGAITALGDTLFPAGSLGEGIAEDFAPTAHFLQRLRIWHPVTAILVGLFVAGSSGLGAMLRPGPATKKLAVVVGALFLAQIGAGFLNLALLAPVWMQLVHLLLADLVWIALVLLGAELLGTAPATAAREAHTAQGPEAHRAETL